jgi:hypothetical protein
MPGVVLSTGKKESKALQTSQTQTTAYRRRWSALWASSFKDYKDAEGVRMDKWIFFSLPVAAALHILEEYIYPGGFAQAFNKLMPRASHLFTVKFHVAVNGIFFLMCIIAAMIGKANLIVSLSLFGLIFINAILHIREVIIRKGYYPGVVTGLFIYIPITIYTYYYFVSTQHITWSQVMLSFVLGISYMVALMIYVLVQQRSATEIK